MESTSQTSIETKYVKKLPDGRIACTLCPRECAMKDGQKGLCFIRGREGDKILLYSYGRSSGFCIDPIEKKPLNHFYPGSSVLSYGTAGCNLFCNFCQNWDISKSKEMDRLMQEALPEQIAKTAEAYGARSVAYTYNDPVIFLEYAVDTAIACKEKGIASVAVTAGYINPEARKDFFPHMDAVNVDLKGFSEDFYKSLCSGSLQPVLDTLRFIKHETNAWLEITNLLIPGQNDCTEDIRQMCEWIVQELGPEVPVHFSAFHPDYKMKDTPATPPRTLARARQIAMDAGLHYVYTGNIHDLEGDTTFCKKCSKALIRRDWYEILEYHLTPDGRCPDCATPLDGRFDTKAGTWGRKRLPVTIQTA